MLYEILAAQKPSMLVKSNKIDLVNTTHLYLEKPQQVKCQGCHEPHDLGPIWESCVAVNLYSTKINGWLSHLNNGNLDRYTV